MAATAKHVLCIVEAGPLPEAAQDGIYTIRYRDIAAVVRDAPLPAPPPTRQALVEHFQLLEQIMAAKTMIPVGFGTIAGSDEQVAQSLLAPRYEEWQALLTRLAGKVELGLKVRWREMKTIFAEVVAGHESIRALRDRAALRPHAQTYHERIEIGRLVAEALSEKKRQEAEQILQALAPLAVETHRGKLLGDDMILNAAFLVQRRREAELDEAVSRLAQQQGERLIFRYVGPAPPFSFAGAAQHSG
jgi:hypothetical protein